MKRSSKKAAGLVPALLAVATVTPVWAHHSFAMFDMNKTIVMEGTASEFQWTNPHSWLQVKVVNPKGVVEEWSIELGTISGLHAAGWKPRTVKEGDKVKVTVHPLRDGTTSASLVSIVLPNGQVLTNDRPAQQNNDAAPGSGQEGPAK